MLRIKLRLHRPEHLGALSGAGIIHLNVRANHFCDTLQIDFDRGLNYAGFRLKQIHLGEAAHDLKRCSIRNYRN